MALEENDIERIGMMMSLKLQEALEEINELVREHNQTLYGPKGKNGLVDNMKEARKEILSMKLWSAGIAGGISVLAAIGRDFIKSLFGSK